jgi:hypothetical protein
VAKRPYIGVTSEKTLTAYGCDLEYETTWEFEQTVMQ